MMGLDATRNSAVACVRRGGKVSGSLGHLGDFFGAMIRPAVRAIRPAVHVIRPRILIGGAAGDASGPAVPLTCAFGHVTEPRRLTRSTAGHASERGVRLR